MELSIHFRKTNKDPSMHFRRANTDPSMKFRKANAKILLPLLLPSLLTMSLQSLFPVLIPTYYQPVIP